MKWLFVNAHCASCIQNSMGKRSLLIRRLCIPLFWYSAQFQHGDVIPSRLRLHAAFLDSICHSNQMHCLGLITNKERVGSFFLWPITLGASSRYQPPQKEPTSFAHLPLFSFRMAWNYSNWSISIYQGSSQRLNENSLVRCIGGETNFRLQQKVGMCAHFFLNFSSELLTCRLCMHGHVCACVFALSTW